MSSEQAPQPRSDPAREGRREPVEIAVLGGAPAFETTQHVGRPNVPDRADFMRRMESILDSQRLTNLGPQVLEFEQRVAEVAGARHCVATCNATVALELAIGALGMTGDVIVPSFTFVADAHALWWQGVRPVFVDVDARTHCLDPGRVEAAITPRTTGILAVHLWGNACDVEALGELAERHRLRLLYDAAHAFGSTCLGRPIGAFGQATVFSFHATKFVNAFEGGAIVTDDEELARRLRLMTNFGFSGEDVVERLGINGKMSEVSAAMGITSLEGMRGVVDRNRANHEAFSQGLASVPGVRLVQPDPNELHNYHYVVTEVDEEAGLTRDELVAALRLENVFARRYFHPGCHRMEPYLRMDPDAGRTLAVTEALSDRVMVLPTGTSMSVADCGLLAQRIRAIVGRSAEVRRALRACEDERLPPFYRA